jgi:hypothetical protein
MPPVCSGEQERHGDRGDDLDSHVSGGVLHPGHESDHRAGQHGIPDLLEALKHCWNVHPRHARRRLP